MELITFHNDKQYDLPQLVVALGHFDGLHRAHRLLIGETVRLARQLKAASAVITLEPHPDYVLKKRPPAGYLTPLPKKAEALGGMGVDYLIVIPFNEEVSRLSYERFESDILAKFTISVVVVGFDYRYGHKGIGTGETLRKKYQVRIMEPVTYQNRKIGSNAIREMLTAGDLTSAREVLGGYYLVTGTVIAGEQIGRTFGIRTANIQIGEDYQFLKTGVYAVIATVDGRRYRGVANYGVRPTFNIGSAPRLEVHIIDFSGIIYDKDITVEFVAFVREEQKFHDIGALAAQINKDIKTVRDMEIQL